MDAWGHYPDKVSGRNLNSEGVTKAGAEQFVEVAQLYDKMELEQC